MFRDDHAGGGVQIARAAVVPEAAPAGAEEPNAATAGPRGAAMLGFRRRATPCAGARKQDGEGGARTRSLGPSVAQTMRGGGWAPRPATVEVIGDDGTMVGGEERPDTKEM